MTETIRVNAGKGYDILVGRGILGRSGELISQVSTNQKAVVVTDSNVEPLYGAGVVKSLEACGIRASLFTFPAGETSKNHHTLIDLYGFLAAQDMTRSDLIIAVGGGVTGDIAGFAAATYLRGLDFIQIPTTLLAQIDSSIGGKTGVDLKEGKNLVGAFWQPKLVLCDPDTLSTLEPRVFSDGMAECIKHACILDRKLFNDLEACGHIDSILDEMICSNIKIKAGVVERDEREKGERMLLNFGHTLGHAIEKIFQYETYSHGEAVAIGMVLMTRQAEKNGLTKPGNAERIALLLKKYGLPDCCPKSLDDITGAAINDKKRSGDKIRIVLLEEIGKSFVHTLPVSEIPRFFGLERD